MTTRKKKPAVPAAPPPRLKGMLTTRRFLVLEDGTELEEQYTFQVEILDIEPPPDGAPANRRDVLFRYTDRLPHADPNPCRIGMFQRKPKVKAEPGFKPPLTREEVAHDGRLR